MRELSETELSLISGGYYEDEDIVVIGPPGYPSMPVFPVFPVFPGYTQPPPPPPSYGGGPPPPPPPPPEPDCHNSNAISGMEGVDGAEYMVPEQVTAQYLLDSFRHVQDLNIAGDKFAAVREVGKMYSDPSNPFFADFKRAGTASGPAAWTDAGDVSYFSTSLNQTVQGDAFEAFGNFWFGYLMTGAGFAPEETKVIAALVQGQGYQQLTSYNPLAHATAMANATLYGDDPKDRPFVDHGIAKAQAYLVAPNENFHQFGVDEGECGDGA